MLVVRPARPSPAEKEEKPSRLFHKAADAHQPVLQQRIFDAMLQVRKGVDRDLLARAFEARDPTRVEALLGLARMRLVERRQIRDVILNVMAAKGEESASRLMRMRRLVGKFEIYKANEDAKQSGVMVALVPPAGAMDQLREYAAEEERDNLHMTLVYLGKVQDLTQAQIPWIAFVVKSVAHQQAPLQGMIQGVGRFNGSPSSDGKDVFWAHVDMPGLNEFRQKLVDELRRQGLPVKADHGFTPHITLAYIDPDAKLPMEKIPSIPFAVDRVFLKIGDHKEVVAFSVLKGDVPGHPFHGNQWGDGASSSSPLGDNVRGWIKPDGSFLPLPHELHSAPVFQDEGLRQDYKAAARQSKGRLTPEGFLQSQGWIRVASPRYVSLTKPTERARATLEDHLASVRDTVLIENESRPAGQRAIEVSPDELAANDFKLTEILKGDVPGHEFHGNQWGESSGTKGVKPELFTGEAREQVELALRDTRAGHTQMKVVRRGNDIGVVSYLPVSGALYINHMASSRQGSGAGTSAIKAVAAEAAKQGKALYGDPIIPAKQFFEALGWHRLESGWQGLTAEETQSIAKGDVPGHEFHGNQWTGGGGKLSAWTPGPRNSWGVSAEAMPIVNKWLAKEKEIKWTSPTGVEYTQPSVYRQAAAQKLAAKTGLSEERCNAFLESWLSHSSDSRPDSIAMQIAVAKMMGDDPGRYLSGLSYLVDDARQGEADQFVKGMYDATQQSLKEAGIDTVYVSRGVRFGGEYGQREPSVFRDAYFAGEKGADIKVGTSPMSSWSLNPETSRHFAQMGDERSTGYVLTAQVPASRVVGWPFTGVGSLGEMEFVVAGDRGHTVHATVVQGEGPVLTDAQAEQMMK